MNCGLILRSRRQVMFFIRIRNRGGGSFRGKLLIKEQPECDISVEESSKDFQLVGGHADGTQERLELKAIR